METLNWLKRYLAIIWDMRSASSRCVCARSFLFRVYRRDEHTHECALCPPVTVTVPKADVYLAPRFRDSWVIVIQTNYKKCGRYRPHVRLKRCSIPRKSIWKCWIGSKST